MYEFLQFVLSHAGPTASLVMLPAILWLVIQMKNLSGGTMASLKVQLYQLHEEARRQMKRQGYIDDCTKESFWTAFKHYTTLKGNGRAKVWADDMDRWQRNGKNI